MIKRKLTLSQERLAYKRAVHMILCVFFGKSRHQATALVEAWWRRMGKGPVYTTGIFLHDEPVNTAAALAGVDGVPSISTLGPQYERIIEASMPRLRTSRRHKVQAAEEHVLQAS